MDVEGVVLFWVVLGCVFCPVMVIAYLASIIKAITDRRRIRAKQEAIRKCRMEGIPISTLTHTKKPNIQVVEDSSRARKWKFYPSSSNLRSSRSNRPSTSAVTEHVHEENQNRPHSVKVTVEHNPEAPNGLGVHKNRGGRRGKKELRNTSQGVDNMGGSFGDISDIDTHIATIEMDNLSNDEPKDKYARATRSKGSSPRRVNSETEAESHSELGKAAAETSPNLAPDSSRRLLASSRRPQQLSNHHLYEPYQHRPQKPRRGFKSHAFSYHNEKGSMNGSVKNLDNAEDSLASLNGVRVLVSSQSQDKEMNLVSHYTRSNRRSSYAAAIDTDYEFEDSSPTRSLSDDNLHRLSESAYPSQPRTVPHPDQGQVGPRRVDRPAGGNFRHSTRSNESDVNTYLNPLNPSILATTI